MNTIKFLESIKTVLKENGKINAEIASDRNFPGGYYLNFSEFGTAVLRVNKDGKFSMRGVEIDGDRFQYPFSYKFLIPTDELIKKLEDTFEKIHLDGEKEVHRVVFPVFCYLSVLHQFYKRSLSSKKKWFERYKEIEKRSFNKVRGICSGLPSRQALKLLSTEDQSEIMK